MLALIVAFALSSPISGPELEPPCDEHGFPVRSERACRASCEWWSRAEARCRDSDVENLGTWDPRPAQCEWSSGYSLSPPQAWPEYPLEKANAP